MGGDIMTSEFENLSAGAQRTRRNMMKMGAILVPATLGKIHSAAAQSCDTPFRLVSIVCDIITHTPPDNRSGGGGKPNCSLKGTKIRTAKGERKIEDLVIGDFLPTMFGGLRPIQWIGRYPITR